jgi:acetyl-CoA carboxylase carboxyl transferase subunit alpha
VDSELADLENKAKTIRDQIFAKLSPYESTQIARHPRRPNTLELIAAMTTGFIELHGDRNFLDDQSIVGGLARIDDIPVMIIGHQKGRGTKDNIFRNFGMPRPEGYRKALRMMSMAERFKLPIVTLIDTPGAYPGIDAEERGQSEAIAKNIMVMTRLRVPVVAVVTGEGGSGGALAIAVANRVYMLEHGVYSVISPEGCASILMKSAAEAPRAAEMLKITAKNALEFGVIDGIIKEPEGGAHRDLALTADRVRSQIVAALRDLMNKNAETLRDERFNKYLHMGKVIEQ